MPEETEKQPEETNHSPDAQENGASNPEALAAITAQLREEQAARAAIEATLAQKDARIAELETSLTEAKQAGEAAAAELTHVKEAHGKAVAKYLGAIRIANPAIPQDVISGATIDEIDASLARAASIADSVKASLEAQAKQTRVPAGAPQRGEISLEGLSPREKIAAGIQQKGGAS
jgi:chromosome segregation ATPase